jgi:uncharacterized short protein YbdD (DUF466 family)
MKEKKPSKVPGKTAEKFEEKWKKRFGEKHTILSFEF